MADERKYFVICADNCKFESMTKEQILTAIEQAIKTGQIKDVDTGFITTVKEQNTGAGVKLWIGTTAQYEAQKDSLSDTFCIITDDTTAEDITAAITEVKEQMQTVETAVVDLKKRTAYDVIYEGGGSSFSVPSNKFAWGQYKSILIVAEIYGGYEYKKIITTLNHIESTATKYTASGGLYPDIVKLSFDWEDTLNVSITKGDAAYSVVSVIGYKEELI